MTAEQAPPARPCCPVGAREDVAAIDAALRASALSLSALAVQAGLNKGTLHRHREHLPEGPAVPETDAATGVKRPETVVTAPPTDKTRARANHELAQESPGVEKSTLTTDPDVEEFRRRLASMANIIASAADWNVASVEAFAAKWGCSTEEVERLHRLAAIKVRKARGSLAGQRETSVALLKQIIAEERAAAKEYRALLAKEIAAQELLPGKERTGGFARHLQDLANKTKAGLRETIRDLNAITFLKPVQHLLQVNMLEASPDFARGAAAMVRICAYHFGRGTPLPAMTAGEVQAHIEAGMAAWGEGGDAGLEAHFAELEGGELLLMPAADGTYG